MPVTMSDDVLELARPAINTRIKELVESAFKLARFSGGPDVLEGAIDECTSKYFGDSSQSMQKIPASEMTAAPESSQNRSTIVGRNIVKETSKFVRADSYSEIPQKHHTQIASSTKRRNISYAPGTLVKASAYTAVGRPVSKYTGVSYSGSVRFPWVVRYQKTRVGIYESEEEAARVYDSVLIKNGKNPVNFRN